MAAQTNTRWWQRPFFHGATLAILAGAFAWLSEPGRWLEHWSFDLPTLASRSHSFPELVLIEMDEPAFRELHQDYGQPWNHQLHADLVDYLRQNGARQIVFDVEFSEQPRQPAETAALAEAFRRHGHIVLGAALTYTGRKGFGSASIVRPPLRELLVPGVTWAVSWDLPGPWGEEDGVVRLHPRGRDPDVSVPWAAAVTLRPALTNCAGGHDGERWVRHYGPGGTLPRVSYWQATNAPPGFYGGRTVFIGGGPATKFAGQIGDQFRTPWSRGNRPAISGLELTATAWLNLVREDWLTRLPPPVELSFLVILGGAIGGLVTVSPLRRAIAIGAGSIVGLALISVWLRAGPHLWGNWMITSAVQVPVALLWRLVRGHLDLRLEKRWLEAPLESLFTENTGEASPPTAPLSLPSPGLREAPDIAKNRALAPSPDAPSIPDFVLLRCVGRGAYGEVWLARDVLGILRVIKIVRRVAFDRDEPYEREFSGLQRYSPISREHPGLVQILHAGQNRAEGYFHYAMEAGDDEQSGQIFDPERYVPRNLERDLRLRGPMNPEQTAQLGIALSDALGFLHEHGLIHRDLKPANVIFVKGRPKLADIGLVTASGSAGAVTQVGTEGFIPPEGLGGPSGDLFALGRLLAQCLGPRFQSGDARLEALQQIVARAHAGQPEDRFACAGDLSSALMSWQTGCSPSTRGSASLIP